jgi:alkanesulfonate monooxygenase SsuD/methylene tetrahydromethanopterin reductase-like flavin-dependent oxidoreductase (luciferase family)
MSERALSMYVPMSLHHATAFLPWAALAQESGVAGLWTGQSLTTDVVAGAAFAAGRGVSVPVRTGVNVMPTTTPYAAALQVRGLVETTGQPVVSCWSPGDPTSQVAFRGTRYRSPLTATREFVTGLRSLLDGETTVVRGDYFPTAAQQLGTSVGDRVQIGLGVLRPAMARLTGEIADAAVTWMVRPSYLRDVLVPALDEGAATAGRPRPRVVGSLHATIEGPGRDVMSLAHHAIGFHVDAPHYRDMLARSGHDLHGLHGVDAVRRLVDEQVFVAGSATDVAGAVADLHDAGADEVAVVLHHPPDTTWSTMRHDWGQVTAAVAAQPIGTTTPRSAATARAAS